MEFNNFSDALTFAKSLEHKPEEIHLLFGNGLSIAYKQNFSYREIYSCSNHNSIDSELDKIFKKHTYNFEAVIRELFDTNQLNLIANVKIGFLESFLDSIHPKSSSTVKDAHKNSCATFFMNFSKIFTTNYDLLPYWVNMKIPQYKDDKLKNKKIEENRLRYTDGFSQNSDAQSALKFVWKNKKVSNEASLLYLHGGVHIFNELREIGGKLTNSQFTYKIIYSEQKGRLIEQIKKYIQRKSYPVIVMEGTSESKQKVINSNDYLSKAHKIFSYLKDDMFHLHKGRILFIYGHSLSDEDEHIIKAIKSSHTIAIFCSVFENNQLFKDRINTLFEGIPIYFYNARSEDIWFNSEVNKYLLTRK